MPPQPPAEPQETVDRALLEMSREECLALLASNSFGRLAVTGTGDLPIIRPVNYAFDKRSQSVVFRTALGSKFHYLVRATRAAFEIDHLHPATRTGWSVIVAGVTEEVTNPIEVSRLERLRLDTWAPGERSNWIRIRALTVTGRRISQTERTT